MTRFRAVLSIAALTTLAMPLAGAPKPSNVPARVSFAADPLVPSTYKIRTDGGGTQGVYVDGEDCVQSWYALPKGNFFLRTVRSGCGEGSIRALVLDFSDRVWPAACTASEFVEDRYGHALDICGVNAVADARLVADKLFAANVTALDIPFSLQPDFRYTAFDLDFVETLDVSISGVARTMTAAPTAIAELWQINGRSKTLLGRYQMPFSATVESKVP